MSEKFIVETSARHVHLTAEAFAVLFGEGKELTVKKMLSQPGQFASEGACNYRWSEEGTAERFDPRPVPQRKPGRAVCNRCTFYRYCSTDPGIR